MTSGNQHSSMSGSCGVCVDGVLYLFGGHHARGNTNRVSAVFVCMQKYINTVVCVCVGEKELVN